MSSSAITVILPARNARATVRAALVSTMRGLPDGSRILVRDDASTDGTADSVRALRDPRIQVLTDEAPLGVAGSLNALLDAVDTPLVARMDADDLMLPGRWAAQTAALHAGADLAFTSVIDWWARPPIIRPQRPERVDAAVAPLLLLVDNPFMHPTMLCRTSTLRLLGGYRPVASEDYELWLRAAEHGMRLTRLATPRLLYRRHAQQVTAQKSWRSARADNPVVEESFGRLAQAVLGFVPGWFAWRRDGFPADRVPPGVGDELDALAEAARTLPVGSAQPLLRRLRRVRRHAARGTR